MIARENISMIRKNFLIIERSMIEKIFVRVPHVFLRARTMIVRKQKHNGGDGGISATIRCKDFPKLY